MVRILLAVLVSIITVSCSGPRYADYFPYHDDGTLKPKVALMPIVISTDSIADWDIGEELSEGIYFQLMNSGEFYVPTEREMGEAALNPEKFDVFSDDVSCFKCFGNTDFVVGMELIEHTMTYVDPCSQTNRLISNASSANRQFSIRVRIKIIDIRCQTPRTILYEIFKTSYSLTPSKNMCDSDRISWKSPGYEKTPCGIAHDRLIRSLTARLEEVIWSSK